MTISNTQPAIPDWLPDWEDATQYPDPKTTSSRQWTWEFLRRNLEYQRLWNELIAPYYDEIKGYQSVAAGKAAEKRAEADPIIQRLRAEKKAYRITPPHVEFEERFGIRFYPPPPWQEFKQAGRKPTFINEWLKFAAKLPRRLMPEGEPYEIQVTLYDREVLIWFNLNYRLEDQIERARGLLEGRKKYLRGLGELKEHRSRDPRLYQTYLRLLDAEVSGASLTEMGKVLFALANGANPKARAFDSLKSAKRIRDYGYLYLSTPSKNRKK
ncbi:MAG TPA: hypothetical protein VF913_12940 [Xanthobacteraceae bacterium]